MGDNIKILRKENDALKAQLNDLTKEMEKLKNKVEQEIPSAELNEQAKGLQYLSKEYEDLSTSNTSLRQEMQRLSSKLAEISHKVYQIDEAIENAQQYSYQYNVKIVGVPKMAEQESALDTANLCLKLFKCIGVDDISIQDIDIAHRVPRKESSRHNAYPEPIICKFTRRLSKEAVMAAKKATRNLTPDDLRLPPQTSVKYIRMYDHLTPKLQSLFHEAKRFKSEYNFKFCWTKNMSIFLRKDESARVFKLKNPEDLARLQCSWHAERD